MFSDLWSSLQAGNTHAVCRTIKGFLCLLILNVPHIQLDQPAKIDTSHFGIYKKLLIALWIWSVYQHAVGKWIAWLLF